jgi:hypothetical protein
MRPWGPARQRVAVDHRELVIGAGAAKQRRHIEPIPAPGLERTGEHIERDLLVPVALGRRVARHLQLGDPVDQRFALVGVASRDRVGHQLLVGVSGHHHAGAGQEGLADGGRAPQYPAGVARRPFVRIELAAHRRMNAVGRDDGVGPLHPRAAAVAIEQRDAGAVGIDRDGFLAAMHGLRPQALQRGLHQQHLQLAAVNRKLRHPIAGGQAARLAPDALAVPVEIADLGGAHAQRIELRQQSQRRQLDDRAGLHIDAHAQRANLRRRFEDLHGHAARLEHQREREPADATADDGYFHGRHAIERQGEKNMERARRGCPLRCRGRSSAADGSGCGAHCRSA